MNTTDYIIFVAIYVFIALVWAFLVALRVAESQSKRRITEGKKRANWVFLAPVWPLAIFLLVKPLVLGIWFVLQTLWGVFMVAIGKWETLDG
jgi:hypothetical protein